MIATIKELFIEVLPHMPYLPDLTLTKYQFIGPIRVTFHEIIFCTDKEMQCAVQNLLIKWHLIVYVLHCGCLLHLNEVGMTMLQTLQKSG